MSIFTRSENNRLIEKVNSEKAVLQWQRTQGDHLKMKIGFGLVALLSILLLVTAFIPGIGFDAGAKIYLPVIMLILGNVFAKSERAS